jgi:16S rRNA U516 pseudouridylate synthase RsuA-like enzyme
MEPYLSQLRAAGRLDKNTEGLLLFTNHGRWNIALTNPMVAPTTATGVQATIASSSSSSSSYTIWKRYRCVLQNPATVQDLQCWVDGGIPFRHRPSDNGFAYSQPAQSAQFVPPLETNSVHHLIYNNTNKKSNHNDDSTSGTITNDYYNRIVDVTIGEGKYRQVRRCWESLSNNKVIHLQRLSFGPIELIPTHQSFDMNDLPNPNTNANTKPPSTTAAATTTTSSSSSSSSLLLRPGQWRTLTTTELQHLEQYVHLWYRHNPNYSDSKI